MKDNRDEEKGQRKRKTANLKGFVKYFYNFDKDQYKYKFIKVSRGIEVRFNERDRIEENVEIVGKQ